MTNKFDSAVETLFNGEEPATNPFEAAADAFIEQENDEQKARDLVNTSFDPDQYAKDSVLAKETKLPIETVQRNREQVVREKQVRDFQTFGQTIDNTPALQEALKNNSFARIAHDDLETLSGIEKGFHAVNDTLVRAPLSESIGYLPSVARGTADLLDSATYKVQQGVENTIDHFLPGFKAEVDRLRASGEVEPAFEVPDISEGLRSVAQPLQTVSDKIAVPEERRNFATDVTGGLGQMGAQIATVLLNPAVGTAGLFAQGADQQGQRADAAGATEEERANAVLVGAGITAVTERLGLDVLLNRVPPQIKNKVIRQFTDVGLAGGIEAVQELAEGVLHNLTARAFYDPDAEILEGAAYEGAVAGTSGAIARGIILTAVPGKQAKTENEAMERGVNEANALQSMVEQVRQSKLLQRDPDEMHGLLKKMAEANEAARNVYISANAVQTLNQSGVPLEDMFEAIPESREQFEEALVTGGDMVMTTEDWTRFLAQNPEYDDLIQETRFSVDALPASAMGDFNQMVEEIKAREAERVAQDDVQAASSPEQMVFDDVYVQLTNAGLTPHNARNMAALQEAFWRTRAQETGSTALDLYNQTNLQVRRELPPQLAAENLGFLFSDTEIQDIKSKVSEPAAQFVREAINVKRTLDTIADPVDTNSRRQVEKLVGRKIDDDALSIIKRLGLATGLDANSRANLKDTNIKFRKKGKLVNYYNSEFVEALNEDANLIRQVMRDDGVEIDGVIEAFHEAGFFPQHRDKNDVPDEDAMDIIRRAASGELVLPQTVADQVSEYLRPFEDAERIVEDLDVHQGMTVEEISERMAELYATPEQDLQSSYDQLFQSRDNDQLAVLHNLRSDNLENVKALGGLPVPSLAIAKPSHDFNNFGEITLVGDKDMVDPKLSKANKVFGADVYSPRYPGVTRELDNKVMRDILSTSILPALDGTGLYSDDITQSLEDDGYGRLESHEAIRYAYLKEIGQAPELENKETEPHIVDNNPELEKYVNIQPYDLVKIDKFHDDIKRLVVEPLIEKSRAKNLMKKRFYGENGDGKILFNVLDAYAMTVTNYQPAGPAVVDTYKLRSDIRTAIEGQQEFSKWVRDTFSPAVKRERIFDGYTPSGNRKYLDHNLDNVVRILKRGLRDGENFNYGVGSIRSTFTPQFKSINHIKLSSDLLVSEQEFENLKDEIDDQFTKLADSLRQNVKGDPDSFRYLDNFSEHLKEIADVGSVTRVLDTYYENLSNKQYGDVQNFVDALRTMPTQYFEAKIQRAVFLNEFKGAVVPKGKSYDEAVKILEAEGLEIERYEEGDAASRRAALAKFNNTFFQSNELSSVRGSITFEETRTLIKLGENADLSTFLHESAHLFVKAMRDLASDPHSNERTVKIYNDLSAWVGSETGKFTVEQEEKVARAFEAYLREGKAPSISLRDAFRAFQSWLLRIYKTMRGLDVQLDPEIRDIFDRMVATDEEINLQAAEHEFTADPAIMEILNKAEREDYIRKNDEATRRAKERMLSSAIKQKEVEAKEEYRQEREAIRAEVEAEVQSDPVQIAFKVLTTGKDFQGNDQNILKLNKQALIDQFGADVINKLPRTFKRIYTVDGGITADDMADQFGVKSGDEMVRRLLNLEKPKELIERRTDDIMRDRHGDMMRDGTIEREARDSVFNDQRGVIIADELAYLSRETGQRNTPAEVAKAVADDLIAKKKVPLAQQFSRYVTSQVKAARQAGSFLAKKDYAKAATAKRQELLNHYLYMASRDADKEVIAALRFFKRLEGKSAQKSIDPEYLEQIYDIMQRYDFRKSTTRRQISKRKALAEFIREREAAGDSITVDEIPERLRNDAEVISYKEMDMSEFRALRDTVQQLAHLGRLKNKLLLGKERRDLQETADAVANSILDNNKTVTKKIGRKLNMAKLGNQYKLAVLHPTTILRELDGFTDLGSAFKHIKGVVDQAVSDKLIPLEHKIAERVEELFSVYNTSERGQMASTRIEIPELDDSLTKFQIISMGLNWGNEGNRKAITDGYGLDERQVQTILNRTLDKRDWDFIQSVWDYVDSFWPELSALEKKRKGVAPEKVRATKIQTEHGEYAGGYYPLKFDSDLDLRVGEETAEELMQHYRNGRFARAQTRKGHTIERKGSGGRPPRLDMGVLSQHLKQVAYDISMHEAITYADRVLHHNTVRSAFEQVGKAEYWRTLDLWLKDAALGEIRQGDVISSVFRHLRVGFTVSKLAWNVGTILVQPLGYAQTVSTLGGKYAMKGLADVASAPLRGEKNAFGLVQELSPFMRKRMDTWNKDISETMRTTKELIINDKHGIEANLREKVFQPLQSSGFYLIGRAQYLVDTATWMGAYRKGLEQFDTEQEAIQYADDIVKRSQASGIFSDRSGFERGTLSNSLQQTELIKVWTTLASYMIAKANIAYEKTKNTDFKNPRKVMQYSADMAMLFLLEAMVLAAMRGTWPDEDDEETIPGFLAKEMALQVAGTMPFVREFASEASGFRGGGGPFGALVKDSIGLSNQIQQGEFDASLVKHTLNVGGILFHLPASQPNRFIDAMFREAEGEDVPMVEYFIWRESD